MHKIKAKDMKFTPTQELIIDVLVSRARMGEHLWTFDSRLQKQMDQLQEAGWVSGMHGIVENTIRASLTEAGKARWLSFDYEMKSGKKKNRKRTKEYKKLLKNMGGKGFWKDSK